MPSRSRASAPLFLSLSLPLPPLCTASVSVFVVALLTACFRFGMLVARARAILILKEDEQRLRDAGEWVGDDSIDEGLGEIFGMVDGKYAS